MFYIFGLAFVALFTYAACMMEHRRVLDAFDKTARKTVSTAKNNAFKDGWNKCYEELMPRVSVDNLKMTRETLARAQTMMSCYGYPYESREVQRIQYIIDEIDKLRPLGPDGKHGNLHTEFCGCEDK